MAISLSERSPDQLKIIKDAIKAELAQFWSALPCEVETYDPDAVTVTVQPTIRIPIRTIEGELELLQMPVLQDVPVMFPCAGGFTITHPIKKGDECFVVFADRNIDLWWQSGGIQNPFDMRKHDLSDGFAFFRPQSQTNKITGISTEDLEIRNDENSCKIKITPAGEIHFIGTKSIFECPVEMKETLSVDKATNLKTTLGVLGKSTFTAGASISGIEFDQHLHGGVKSGGDDSGTPK